MKDIEKTIIDYEEISKLEGFYLGANVQAYEEALLLEATDLKSAQYKLDKIDDAIVRGFELGEQYKKLLDDIKLTEEVIYDMFGDLSEFTEEIRQAYIEASSLEVTNIESGQYKLDRLDDVIDDIVDSI